MSPETLRAHTLKIGAQLCDIPTAKPVASVTSITVTTDSTFIRSCETGRTGTWKFVLATSRHPMVGGRSSVPSPDPTPLTLRFRFAGASRRSARTAATKVTAFTDGCPGLRSILAPMPASPRRRSPDWFPHRHAAAAREVGGKRIAHRRTRVARRPRPRSSRRSSGCTGASGTARPQMPRRRSFDRIRKVACISTRMSAVIAPEARHHESYGMRFTRSTDISVARASGLSTTPRDTAPACGSRTALTEGTAKISWSIAG